MRNILIRIHHSMLYHGGIRNESPTSPAAGLVEWDFAKYIVVGEVWRSGNNSEIGSERRVGDSGKYCDAKDGDVAGVVATCLERAQGAGTGDDEFGRRRGRADRA